MSMTFNRILRNVTLLTVLTLLLSGCSEIQLASHYAKKITHLGGHSGQSQGHYKVGSSYKIKGVRYYPREDFNLVQTGIASWYGPGFHGKKTANGEIFNQFELTAAHKTLQLPALVRVTNLRNGRSIVVRVNDRGPYAQGRVLDISRRGAELLGFKKAGTAPIRLQVLERESRALARASKSGKKRRIASYTPRPKQRGAPINLSQQKRLPKYAHRRALPPSYANNPDYQNMAILRNDAEAIPLRSNRVQISNEGLRNQETSRNMAFLNELDFMQESSVDGHVNNRGNFLPDGVVLENKEAYLGNIYVQAGSFSLRENAIKLSKKLSNIFSAHVSSTTVRGRVFYRVRLGPLTSVERADVVLAQLINKGHDKARIVVD